MKDFKKILIVIIVVIMIINVLLSCSEVFANSNLKVGEGRPIRVSILLHEADDPYISLVAQSFNEIQKKNEGKVEFTFYDSKGSLDIQNKYIDSILNNGTADLILLNLVDSAIYPEPAQFIINKIKQKNIPVVLFNREPLDINSVRSYGKAYYVGTDAAEAGVFQGKIIIDLWNKDKNDIDVNRDNIMQYVMLMGPRDNLEAIDRTRYSILTINNAGIKPQELALRVANWEEELAKEVMEPVFLQYGNRIETIIANNDAMAIGAIEVLQKYGYNKGDKSKTIPVVGVDAIPEAQKLIEEGVMSGSVLQDAYAMAEATYDIGMNLVYGRPPLEGTPYKFDDTGVSVRIPYKEYVYNPNAA